MEDIRSFGAQQTFLAVEKEPGTPETTGFMALSALKLTPGWDGSRSVVRGGTGKLPTSSMATDEVSPWDADLSPDFNALGLVLSSLCGPPVTTTPGGGSISRQHVWELNPDKEDAIVAYTAIWGDPYIAAQGSYGYFNSLGIDLQRAQAPFTTTFRSRSAQFGATAPTNAVQSLTKNGSPTTGTYTIQLPFVPGAPTTAGVALTDNAAAIKAAIVLLAGVETSDLDVTGGPIGTTPVQITFKGRYGQQDLALVVVANTFDDGGVDVAEVTEGGIPAAMADAPIPSNLWNVSIDDDFASVGGTQYGGAYQVKLDVQDKRDEDAPLNSSIISYEKAIDKAELEIPVDLTLRLDATALALVLAMNTGVKQFFRNSISTDDGPFPYFIEGSIPYSLSIDYCAEVLSRGTPTTAPNSSATALPLSLQIMRDSESGKALRFTLVNSVVSYT